MSQSNQDSKDVKNSKWVEDSFPLPMQNFNTSTILQFAMNLEESVWKKLISHYYVKQPQVSIKVNPNHSINTTIYPGPKKGETSQMILMQHHAYFILHNVEISKESSECQKLLDVLNLKQTSSGQEDSSLTSERSDAQSSASLRMDPKDLSVSGIQLERVGVLKKRSFSYTFNISAQYDIQKVMQKFPTQNPNGSIFCKSHAKSIVIQRFTQLS